MSVERRRLTETCNKVQRLLALGEPVADRRLQEHLQTCVPCRGLAKQFAQLKQGLAASAVIEPPPSLDQLVRTRLLEEPLGAWTGIRPAFAAGLAVAALVALVAAWSGFLAQAGAAERGPVLAVAAATIYLMLSFAATLPLLLRDRLRQWLLRSEVNS